ncbi:MAG: hypothetical protein AVDCRST_MAG96-3866 [uncultured Segetibacter sp.]|uniref:Uncharacterized protein n=1 Tax=uncultured Segetibacter sp. TaxID=481133 RepID=A0A6J4U086_9BACT|nr:MAG: hypothetical protein AVDCRST_MAG96-3866 [uncultured Segetibacter sp.]
MKRVILLFAFGVLSTAVFSQSDKFQKGMQTNIALLDSAKTASDLTTIAANFERIGDAEKTQWLPYYYAGLALTRVGWMDQKIDKDKNAEQIKALCNKAEAIDKNAEILSIRNMAATQQMLVNPQERWQTYGQEASAALQQGMQLDPNNPRLYYLQAMTLFNTPEQFGGGKEKAKPVFEKSLALFKAFKPKSDLYPTWGQKITEEMLQQCK